MPGTEQWPLTQSHSFPSMGTGSSHPWMLLSASEPVQASWQRPALQTFFDPHSVSAVHPSTQLCVVGRQAWPNPQDSASRHPHLWRSSQHFSPCPQSASFSQRAWSPPQFMFPGTQTPLTRSPSSNAHM